MKLQPHYSSGCNLGDVKTGALQNAVLDMNPRIPIVDAKDLLPLWSGFGWTDGPGHEPRHSVVASAPARRDSYPGRMSVSFSPSLHRAEARLSPTSRRAAWLEKRFVRGAG
jgi:hypothetical protein